MVPPETGTGRAWTRPLRAAGRHLQGPAPQATLYYLRSAVSYTFAFDEAAVAEGERELAELAESLIAARRSGQFEICRSATCDFCPYGALCGCS